MILKYKGNGTYIVGLPAGDLSEDDIITYSEYAQIPYDDCINVLVESGLYTKARKARKAESIEPIQEDTDNG